MRATVVVPSNRQERLEQFLQRWEPQFNRDNVRVIVCEDHPTKEWTLPRWVTHFSHAEMRGTLGESIAAIPLRSGGVRSFGFWWACQGDKPDMIVSLDDDVSPLPGVDLLADHWAALETPRCLRWWPVAPGFHSRGFPYSIRDGVKPVLNHGLWQGFPDVDAITQMGAPNCEDIWASQWPAVTKSQLVPPGMYYAQCIMNVAFRPEIAPLMWMAKLPDGWKRYDDIWCGVILKRIADEQEWALASGPPFVHHDRASIAYNNLRQEYLGYGLNDRLWSLLDGIELEGEPIEQYEAIWERIADEEPALVGTAEAAAVWCDLWRTA